MNGPVDFPTVQWSRQMTTVMQDLTNLPPADLRKLSSLIDKLADFNENGGKLSAQQLQVILQNLHTKTLVQLKTHKGGAYVEFTGGGFEYERFLIREDGKMPNNRYDAKKSS